MRSLIAIFIIAILFSPRVAQPQQEPESGPAESAHFPLNLIRQMIKIRNAALNDDYAYRQVSYLADNLGPRPVGWPQTEAAVEYVASEMRKLGLDVHLEEVRAPRWFRGVDSAELVDFPGVALGATQKIVVTALGGNHPTAASGLTAEVVVINSFDELKAMGRSRVAGKIVLYNEMFDRQKAANGLSGIAYGEAVVYRDRGAQRAEELGAVASLVRSVGGSDCRLPHTGGSTAAGIPAGAVTSEDADLIAHLVQQGPVRMHLTLTSQSGEEVVTHNVVADLKGTEHPEQIVIVSGHLDSWDLGTGAIDDGAGVAVAMETAQLLRQLEIHPRRTIRVIAWMDEENHGRGHEAYAKAHQEEMPNHVGAIESDLGADHPLGFEAKISETALTWLAPVQEVLRSFGANVIQITNKSPGSDIDPMAKAGVPSFGLLQDSRTYFNFHHTAADTLDKINPELLRENAAAMAVMGYALAEMPQTLPR
ncbi:MAG TPA: M20/M25/M40 family metallo-hydrolase [Terriglobales bacterium]|nr:M20/M25/M40 family metallo-hydrolase [Terriglobales bacterium]